MSAIPLALGDLPANPFTVIRSGIRWLVRNGDACRAGDVIASSRIGLVPQGRGGSLTGTSFAEERYDLHVALVVSQAGRLQQRDGLSLGGDFDNQHDSQRPWDPATVIGTLTVGDDTGDAPVLRPVLLAGRRTTDLAEDRKTLLSGWHDRARAWHGGTTGHATLLSLGICEQNGMVRGERQAFLELLRDSAGPLHAVYVADEGLVPSAPVLLSQLSRTPRDAEAIAADLMRDLPRRTTPGAADYFFIGTALSALGRSPITDRLDILTSDGVAKAPAANTILLSLHAETPVVLRHRRLGYFANWHKFRVQAAGQATRDWLRSAFEVVRRTPDDIRDDYRALAAAVRERTGARLLVMNSVSTSAREDITSYASFDGPLHASLASVRAKELNLMLGELAAEGTLDVLDADAVAAELGAGLHIPDGVHQSGRMQHELRAELLHHLERSRVYDRAPVARADSVRAGSRNPL
ncbi:MAG: hypothetical protein WDN25_03355 [Acetobacteraceae bacterium]